jgi:hypothetical protein
MDTKRSDQKTDVSSQSSEDTAALRVMVECFLSAAIEEGRFEELELEEAREEEIDRLTEQLRELQEQLAARSYEPDAARLSRLLGSNDLDGALQLKIQQTEAQKGDATKLPRHLYELGTIYDLRFDWPKALEAYREAWQNEHNPEYGFSYACRAERQNHMSEAKCMKI